jgi:hypothetical protein
VFQIIGHHQTIINSSETAVTVYVENVDQCVSGFRVVFKIKGLYI